MGFEVEQDRWLHVYTSTAQKARDFLGAPPDTPTREMGIDFDDILKRQRFAVFDWETYNYDPVLDDKKH